MSARERLLAQFPFFAASSFFFSRPGLVSALNPVMARRATFGGATDDIDDDNGGGNDGSLRHSSKRNAQLSTDTTNAGRGKDRHRRFRSVPRFFPSREAAHKTASCWQQQQQQQQSRSLSHNFSFATCLATIQPRASAYVSRLLSSRCNSHALESRELTFHPPLPPANENLIRTIVRYSF